MIASGKAAGASSEQTLNLIYGSVIAAGIFGFLISPFVSRMLRIFPPVATGTIIFVIGISLMRIGINWAASAPADSIPSYGDPLHLVESLLQRTRRFPAGCGKSGGGFQPRYGMICWRLSVVFCRIVMAAACQSKQAGFAYASLRQREYHQRVHARAWETSGGLDIGQRA